MFKRKQSISSDDIKESNYTQISDNRITMVSNALQSNGQLENQYIENIHKGTFLDLCKVYKFSLDDFNKVLTLNEKHRINMFLRTLKNDHNIRIIDSLIYIEERSSRFVQLIKCLDEENLYLLKTEAADVNVKYKMPSNRLKDFLEFETF